MPSNILDISRIPQFQLQWFAEVETIWTEIEDAVNENSNRIEVLEAHPRTIKVDYIDPISAILPTGPSVTIDGSAGQDGDLILFTNLSSGNNKVYELSGVGSSISWTALEKFGALSDQELPEDGDTARVLKGEFFKDQLAVFDGTNWKVNDSIRLFNGADFWELSSLQTADIINNSTNTVFSVSAAGSEHITVNYSIVRGSAHQTGILFISTNAVDEISVTDSFSGINGSGVEFFGEINSGDLELKYTSDNSGISGTMKYYISRWSNSAGGPAGIPNYSSSAGSTVSAAGSEGQLQFNAGGNLAADSRFAWDASQGALNLNGALHFALSSQITIDDNQVTPEPIITYAQVGNEYAEIQYSLARNGHNQFGKLFVAHNGTDISLTNEFTNTGSTGVTFFASLSAGNAIISYTSDSSGLSGTLRHLMKRWGV